MPGPVPACQSLLTLEGAMRVEVMAQEAQGKDEQQQQEPGPGQPEAPSLLCQGLEECRW